MPSLHPIANIKTSWRWLTTTTTDQKKKPKTHRAPIQQDSNYDNNNNNNNNDNNQQANLSPQKRSSYPTHPHLAIPEPALHRLQELKSPPPLPHSQSQSPTAPDSAGFKSRPLYRRTRSASRDLVEEGMGLEKVNVMGEKEKVVRGKVMVGDEGSEGAVGRGKGGGRMGGCEGGNFGGEESGGGEGGSCF